MNIQISNFRIRENADLLLNARRVTSIPRNKRHSAFTIDKLMRRPSRNTQLKIKTNHTFDFRPKETKKRPYQWTHKIIRERRSPLDNLTNIEKPSVQVKPLRIEKWIGERLYNSYDIPRASCKSTTAYVQTSSPTSQILIDL